MIYDGTQKYADNPDAFAEHPKKQTLTDLSNQAERNHLAKQQLVDNHGHKIALIRLGVMLGSLVAGALLIFAVVTVMFSPAKSQDMRDYGTSAYQAQKVVNQLAGAKSQYDHAILNAKTSSDSISRVEYLHQARDAAAAYNTDYQNAKDKYDVNQIIVNWNHQSDELPTHLDAPKLWQKF